MAPASCTRIVSYYACGCRKDNISICPSRCTHSAPTLSVRLIPTGCNSPQVTQNRAQYQQRTAPRGEACMMRNPEMEGFVREEDTAGSEPHFSLEGFEGLGKVIHHVTPDYVHGNYEHEIRMRYDVLLKQEMLSASDAQSERQRKDLASTKMKNNNTKDADPSTAPKPQTPTVMTKVSCTAEDMWRQPSPAKDPNRVSALLARRNDTRRPIGVIGDQRRQPKPLEPFPPFTGMTTDVEKSIDFTGGNDEDDDDFEDEVLPFRSSHFAGRSAAASASDASSKLSISDLLKDSTPEEFGTTANWLKSKQNDEEDDEFMPYFLRT